MAMTRQIAEYLVTAKKAKPFIVSHWMTLSAKPHGGVTVCFTGYQTLRYKCSNETFTELLNLWKRGKGND